MPITPTEWLDEFQVNTGTAATGSQSDPHVIGLSNGNILVAWVESADGLIGTDAGTDIIGVIYDAEGNVVRAAFQINASYFADDELDFDIAATNDGGFILVAVDDDISSVNATGIVWEYHNSNGDLVLSRSIAFENVAEDFLANPQISVNQLTNESVVTYTSDVGTNTNILGVTVSITGTVSTPFDAAQNSLDFDRDGDVAILTNGNLVSVYEEDDAGSTSIEFRISDTTGAQIGVIPNVATGLDPQVAALANGNFVLTWYDPASGNGDIAYRVYSATGSAVTGVLYAEATSDNANEPEVVALPDGGFVIVWDNDTDGTLEGLSFDASGSSSGGSVFTIENVGTTQPNIGVTADGRILFTWIAQDGLGEIFASIWDPRDSTINAGDYDQGLPNFVDTEVITGLTTDTTMSGDGDANTFLGQGGNDTITTGVNDTAYGGAGNDTIFSGGSGVTVFGEEGNDLIYAGLGVNELLDGGAGIDTIDTTSWGGDYELDLNTGITNYATESFINFENVITGIGNDTIIGTSGANSISTGDGADVINSGAGNDTIDGGGGADVIDSGSGTNIVFGGAGGDTITSSGDGEYYGNSGNDLMFAGLTAVSELMDGGNGIDTLDTTSFNGTYVVNMTTGATNYAESFINFENLITGNGQDTITGTSGDNNIVSNGGNDDVSGLAGNDTISGGIGADILRGNNGNDLLFGDGDDDTLIGGNGSDSANGGDGDDLVIGNFGADTLNGNAGDDLIFGGGDDDVIFGGDGRDTVRGGGGADTVFGGQGVDDMFGGNGADQIFGGLGSDFLYGGNGDDTLEGEDGDDRLSGDDGNDTLIGGVGNDLLLGGADNDDIFGGNGNDTIRGGNGADRMYGNFGSDDIAGGFGSDILGGGSGADFLNGGGGNDTLTGGAGQDRFIFDAFGAGNADTITDFNTLDDTIRLDLSVFTQVNSGQLNASAFVQGSSAGDANDRIIYDSATGNIYYDADGSGAGAQVLFATVDPGTVLSASDFQGFGGAPQQPLDTKLPDFLAGADAIV